MNNNHYLTHLPHCGTKIPIQYVDDYFLTRQELKDNIYEYCDIYTDDLFDSFYKSFGGIKNTYSRLFFDPERFGNDEDELMHKKFKLGWFYENAILNQKPLRDTKNKLEIRTYYDEYHQKLSQLVQEKLDKYNKCNIIDCHSFSDEAYWFLEQNLDFPDICIGFEEEHVDWDLVSTIENEFCDYKIGINTPYSGSLIPLEFWQKDFRVKSVMIEINKKIYLQADNVTKNKNYLIVKQKLNNIIEKMMKN